MRRLFRDVLPSFSLSHTRSAVRREPDAKAESTQDDSQSIETMSHSCFTQPDNWMEERKENCIRRWIFILP